MIDRPGRFKAQPLDWTVDETGTNKLLTFIVKFECVSWLYENEWHDAAYGEITGYFYLLKRDGTVNTHAVDSVKQAFGWDGRGVQSLHEGDWRNANVQLTVEEEEYNGRKQLKIKWLNPADYDGGGFSRVAWDTIKGKVSVLDAKLRALNGAPSSAPKPPPGKPTPPKPAPARVPGEPPSAWKPLSGSSSAPARVPGEPLVGPDDIPF